MTPTKYGTVKAALASMLPGEIQMVSASILNTGGVHHAAKRLGIKVKAVRLAPTVNLVMRVDGALPVPTRWRAISGAAMGILEPALW